MAPWTLQTPGVGAASVQVQSLQPGLSQWCRCHPKLTRPPHECSERPPWGSPSTALARLKRRARQSSIFSTLDPSSSRAHLSGVRCDNSKCFFSFPRSLIGSRSQKGPEKDLALPLIKDPSRPHSWQVDLQPVLEHLLQQELTTPQGRAFHSQPARILREVLLRQS